jgi:hypothetical protein
MEVGKFTGHGAVTLQLRSFIEKEDDGFWLGWSV